MYAFHVQKALLPMHFTNNRSVGEELAMDCFDMSIDAEGFRHVLVVKECMTGFLFTWPLRTKRNDRILQVIDQLCCAERFYPDLRMDNGTEFKTLLDAFVTFRGSGRIKRIKPYKPRSNVCINARTLV